MSEAAASVAGEDLVERLSSARVRELARIARRVARDELDAALVEFLLLRHAAIARAVRRLEAEDLFAALRAEGHTNRAAARLTVTRFPDVVRNERTVRRWRQKAARR